MTMGRDRDLNPLGRQIGRLLNAGVALSTTILAIGFVLVLLGHASAAQPTLAAGLIVLICLPVVRVVASFVDAVRRRDPVLIGATGIVLSVLAILLWVLRAKF
jgi:uncharacterized membrane protein